MAESVKSNITTSSSSSSGERLLFLDGLRGLLAILVYIGHVNEFSGGAFGTTGFAAMGYRVAAFFALSGFVQYLSSARLPEVRLNTTYREFFEKRFLRVLPPYYIALLLFLGFNFLLDKSGLVSAKMIDAEYLRAFWYHLGLIQSWQPQEVRMKVNAPLWMMTYWSLYTLGLPVLLLIARRFHWFALLFLLVALLFLPADWYGAYMLMPGYLLAFTFGVMGARVARQTSSETRVFGQFAITPLALTMFLVGVTVFFTLQASIAGVAWMGTGWLPAIGQAVVGLSFAALCLYMTFTPHGFLSRIFSTKPIVDVGTISYSLFLIHTPILVYQSWVMDKFQLTRFAPRWSLYLLMFPIILVASTLFYRLFEEPFIRSRKKAKATPS